MRKSKKKRSDAPNVDLPENPEFQQFADFTRELLKVPKEEIDKRVAEDAKRRKRTPPE